MTNPKTKVNKDPHNIAHLTTNTVSGNIPLVDISPVNSTLFMQDSFDVKFRCSVPDDPRAQFLYWTKDGKQIYSDRGKDNNLRAFNLHQFLHLTPE